MAEKILYMLIGLPASGKSTWREPKAKELGAIVASSDDYIEKMAALDGKTYNEGFREHAKGGEKHVKSLVNYAIVNSLPLIWDQTNLTKESRKKRLAMFPTEYVKIGVVFHRPPLHVWFHRLNSRPGKVIPPTVLQSMEANYQEPTLDEGFDDIVVIDN